MNIFIYSSGEYSNPQLEELIDWINATVPVEASFAGNAHLTFRSIWSPESLMATISFRDLQ